MFYEAKFREIELTYDKIEIDMKNKFKIENANLSLRGMEKTYEIAKSFALLFPEVFYSKANFLEEVTNYRELGSLFSKNGIF